MPLPDPGDLDMDQFLKTPRARSAVEDLLRLPNDSAIVEYVKRQGGAIPLDEKGRWLISCPMASNTVCGLHPDPKTGGRGGRLVCTGPLFKKRGKKKWRLPTLVAPIGYESPRCPYAPNR